MPKFTFAKMQETANMARAIAKSGAISSGLDAVKRFYGGPDLGSIALEYLLSSNVLPLGIILQLFGPEGSGKSTLAADLLNRCFLSNGGEANLIDTEQKINESLMRGILGDEPIQDGRFTVTRAPVLEQAQTVLTTLAKELNKLTHGSKKGEAPHMLGVALDSFRVAAQATIDAVLKSGHASKAFAAEANLWRQYLGAFMSLLQYSPMTLIIVNHQVEKESPAGYGKVYDVGGGLALKFYETYRIQVKTIRKVSKVNDVYSDLVLTTFKNSNGESKNQVSPRIVYRSPDLEEGRVLVDWSVADANLLAGPDIPRSKLSSEGVCNVKETTKAGFFSDDILGLKGVPIKEITDAIYADADRLAKLREILGIQVNHTLDELYEDGWFRDAKAGVGIPSEDE